jgi:hypothetical protein
MPQADVKIVGRLMPALVMDDHAMVAEVRLRGREVTAVLHGALPPPAQWNRDQFRVGIVGPMDGSAIFYWNATRMRPEVRLEIVREPTFKGSKIGPPAFIR